MSAAISPDHVRDVESQQTIWTMPVVYLLSAMVLFGASAINLAVLNVDKKDVGLDPVVLVKLALIAMGLLLGCHSFLSNLKVRAVALSWPAVLILVIFGLYIFASILSSGIAHAIPSSMSILSIYLLTITVSVQLGRLTTLNILFYSTAAFVAGSWVIYFVKPEIGVFMEPITDGAFTRRMSGLSHPNTLGQYCGANLVLGMVLYFTYSKRNLLVIAICLMSAAALYNSLARAATLATIVGVIVGYRHFFLTKRFVMPALGAALLLSTASAVSYTHLTLPTKA